MEEGSKHVQLHIKWPVWIHKRMILMSFSFDVKELKEEKRNLMLELANSKATISVQNEP
jgi:hypothetical protein